MNRNWQIWSLFFLCLSTVAIAMSWLSLKTFELEELREADQAETELARREAELQERISSALYRMDLKMLPLVAQEAARPPVFYQSIQKITSSQNTNDWTEPQNTTTLETQTSGSPWLFATSDSVLLHFEIDSNNTIKSPQLPEADEGTAANANPIGPEAQLETQSRINKARELFDYQTLVGIVSSSETLLIADAGNSTNANQATLAYSVPAVDNFLNQLSASQLGDSEDATSQPAIESPNSPSNSRIDRQRLLADQRSISDLTQRRNSTQGVTQASIGNTAYTSQISDVITMPLTNDPLQLLPMQPIWVGENLIMARRVNDADRSTIQCCWLDWERIRKDLQTEVTELLPEVQFEAVTPETELKIGTALTTIPVQLIVDRPAMLAMLAFDTVERTTNSALPISLLAAWCCLGLAAIASALLLHGVIRLSERRAAFVSAVTHELRTPLTTFRMYSEMLADGMVAPERQQLYANTLKVQADRLSHLVENVLHFARLERGPAKVAVEAVTVSDLLDRFRLRLEERANDSQMQLVFEVVEAVSKLTLMTQPAAIEQILFNLVDNACKYAQAASDRRIVVSVCQSSNRIQFSVRDFGPGIHPTDRKRMYKPFQQSSSAIANGTPGVGLGLALCDRMARSLGGRLIDKTCPNGAIFVLELPLR